MAYEYGKLRPDSITLIPERCDEMVLMLAHGGMTLADVTRLGASPIAFHCNEAWKPVLELLCAKDGYTWEWVRYHPPGWGDEPWPTELGDAVLVKVG